MVNPDGVYFGNFRCDLMGLDLNRQWLEPNKHLQPTVFSIKQLISETIENKLQIELFIDLHGHSKKYPFAQ
jgi:murein tripeptide amidase MpaA